MKVLLGNPQYYQALNNLSLLFRKAFREGVLITPRVAVITMVLLQQLGLQIRAADVSIRVEKDDLEFHQEHNLSKEPLRVVLLVVRKPYFGRGIPQDYSGHWKSRG